MCSFACHLPFFVTRERFVTLPSRSLFACIALAPLGVVSIRTTRRYVPPVNTRYRHRYHLVFAVPVLVIALKLSTHALMNKGVKPNK